jgi:hypothetical protein
MRIDGNTRILAHIGHPTYSFKAPRTRDCRSAAP